MTETVAETAETVRTEFAVPEALIHPKRRQLSRPLMTDYCLS